MTSTSVHVSSGENHCFNIIYAAKYGIEESILIHHFQHWIRVNRRLKRNYLDGRTWMYQTREEIAANFPYFSKHQVQRITDSLVEKGVLIKGNYNKNWQDKTLWYAFNQEEDFVPHLEENLLGSNHLAKPQNRISKSANRVSKNAKALPDTKTADTKNDDGGISKKEMSSSFFSEKDQLRKEIGKTLKNDQFEMGYLCYCDAKDKQDILNPVAWIITAGRKQFKTRRDESKKIIEYAKKIETYFSVNKRQDVSIYAANKYMEIVFPGAQCPSKCINYEGRTFSSWWIEVSAVLNHCGLPQIAL